MARLVCPVCRTVITDGSDPEPGECHGCRSSYAGDGDSAPAAVAEALAEWGFSDLDPGAVTAALFALPPGSGPTTRAAVVSDEREGFYRWWVFAPAGDEGRTVLARLVSEM